MAEAIAESRALHVVETPERVTAVLGQSEPPSPEPLELRWQAADGAERRLRLEGNPVSLGAHPRNDVHLPDRFVSRYHCRLQGRHGRLWIQDLGSTNGTVVDGARVSEAEIGPGSLVRVGDQVLRVEREYNAEPIFLPGVITRDPGLRTALELLKRAAPSRLPVLIQGESGSGKAVAARAVHDLSSRAAAPFVPVNCGAIADEVAEAELFGHERGAFTGAVQSSIGAFGAAEGGTLFLDEIGDLDLAVQAKLLRALQEREITRVGAERVERVDVRVVAATNRDLELLVKEGQFRDDLYYRLNVIPLRLPPLRERPGDLPALLEHFLRSFADRYGRPVPLPPPEVLATARAYQWPGNVRELRNLCERAALMGWDAVAPLLGRPSLEPPSLAAPAEFSLPLLDARARLVERFEREYLTRLLRQHRGKVGEVARAAGIAERNLYEKLKAYGLSRDDYR